MEEIKELLKYGILAPSSHNSQPWAFRLGENYLEIYADLKRWLKESDKEGRMLFVALGCLITNLKIAASHFGLSYKMDYAELPRLPMSGNLLAATMRFNDSGNHTQEDYFQAIAERRSNRNRYKAQPISDADLENLKCLNEEDALKIDLIADTGLKSQIAEISSEAMGDIMSDRNFRRELAFWLRTNLTLKKDGMPGNGHCMPLLVSCVAPLILRTIDVSKVEAKKERARLLNFPTVAIISSEENNPVNWLKTGELLEKVLLAAQSKGIDSAIRVASIEFPESREKLKRALGQTDFIPQMLFGLGYAEKEAPHSPRRNIKEVIYD